MQMVTVAALIVAAAMTAVAGWMLLFRTGHLLHLAHHTHRTSPAWVQNWPGHRVIFKDWYPAYLRVGGVFAWLLTAALLMMAGLRIWG